MTLLSDTLSAANIILAALVAFYQVRYLQRARQPFNFLKLAYAMVAVYWAAIYFWVLFLAPDDYNNAFFGQVFIRPAFTFTLAVMVASAIHRDKTGRV